MTRIVGMTTKPDECRRHWEGAYPNNFHNWKILARYDDKHIAQLAGHHFAGRTDGQLVEEYLAKNPGAATNGETGVVVNGDAAENKTGAVANGETAENGNDKWVVFWFDL